MSPLKNSRSTVLYSSVEYARVFVNRYSTCKFDSVPIDILQGVLGIKVKIMLDWDPKGKQGPMTPLPDVVTIHMPKEEEEFAHKPHVGKEEM